jgi:hypothetical protein
MAKIVNKSHIVGERGAIRFADYCNQHEPYMIFRPVTVNDFGIDGEIELTEINIDNKTTPTAQIIKVQLKSTAKDNSYMKKDTDSSFEFYAKSDDIDYWNKFRQYGIKVLLVIFDDRNDKLYCKEITNIEIAEATPTAGKQSYPIVFSKVDNLLEWGKHNFLELYSKSFKGRVNFNVEETVAYNLLPFKSFPQYLYSYKSKFTDKRKIRSTIDESKMPYFTIYGDDIYTFHELGASFKDFKEQILVNPNERELISKNEILENRVYKNYYIELMNLYIKAFMGTKGLKFCNNYKRFYFRLREDQDVRKAKYSTRISKELGELTVASEYSYGKDTFFRHFAVEFKVIFIEDKPHLLFNHQWYFTKDRKNTIAPDLITKYSNGMNNQLHNKELLSLLHFWWSYLAWNFDTKSDEEMTVFDGKPVKQTSIVISRYIKQVVPFGIPTDGEKVQNKKRNSNNTAQNTQQTLF